MQKLYSYFENLKNEDRLSHSFLIGNVFFDEIKDELEMIVNKLLIDSKMNIEENPDVYILRDNEKEISKDDIKELLSNLNKTSQFHKAKVYIIENCEKLNDFACNALLKTLEEPPQNVYALLLSSNINDVKDTIYSRCQKIFASTSINMIEDDEGINELSDKLIESIEVEGIKTISKNYNFYSIIVDRKQFQKILKNMLYKYKNSLDISLKNKKDDLISKNNDVNEISKKLIVISDNINRSYNYLNKNQMIDRFIIEMWRCKNENS